MSESSVPIPEQCRQMVCGYGPCYQRKGHDGMCAWPENWGMQSAGTYQFKTRIVAVTPDGQYDYDYSRGHADRYRFEQPDPGHELGELLRTLPFAEEELAKAQKRHSDAVARIAELQAAGVQVPDIRISYE